MPQNRSQPGCVACTLGAAFAVAALGFAMQAILSRYWTVRTEEVSGKLLRGRMVRPLPPGGGEALTGLRAMAACTVSGHEECDVYEDWVEVDGRRWTTGYHLENCRTSIDSVDCEGGPPVGGGGDPGDDRRTCLGQSRRTYDRDVAKCRQAYAITTGAIVAGGVLCTVLSLIFTGGITALGCAEAAFAAEAAASGVFVVCMNNAYNDWRGRDQDCLSEPVG